jgi:zinc/manganese transport system substrate-binding protein
MSARARTARIRALVLTVISLVSLGTVSGCARGDAPARIVVTTNILGDVTREIVGDEAEVSVLMKADADPHSFGVSAVQAAELERADLVVYNGLGLEENVLRHVTAARESGVPVFETGRAVDPLTFGTGGEGDPAAEAGRPDPHFWTDPDRMRTAVGLIADQVVEHVDGVDERTVRKNAARYDARLRDLTAWMEKSFAAIPEDRRSLVTNHHVFGYLADRFGLRVIGAVIPSGTTLASPSSSDLRSLVLAMERAHVRTVFADSSRPTRLSEVLRQETGGRVRIVALYSESLTGSGGGAPTYLDMMRANTGAIADGLTGG